MADQGKVKFIRVRGKVVPIRQDGGVNMNARHKVGASKDTHKKALKEASKYSQIKDPKKIRKIRFQNAVSMGAGFGVMGGLLGMIGDAARGKGALGTLIGTSVGMAFGVAAGANTGRGPNGFVDRRKFNKKYGQVIAPRGQ